MASKMLQPSPHTRPQAANKKQDCCSDVGSLHCVDVSSVADVSDVHYAFLLIVGVSRVNIFI
jgi:hypothetical protein